MTLLPSASTVVNYRLGDMGGGNRRHDNYCKVSLTLSKAWDVSRAHLQVNADKTRVQTGDG